MRGENLKLNSVFVKANFKLRKTYEPKERQNFTIQVGGNTCCVYFKKESAILILTHDLRFHFLHSALRTLCKEAIQKTLTVKNAPISVNSVRICTFHLSKTFHNCSALNFVEKLLVPFCQNFKINTVSIKEESSAPSIEYNTLRLQELLQGKLINPPHTLSVSKRKSGNKKKKEVYTIKVQFNNSKRKSSVTCVLTNLSRETRLAIAWWDAQNRKQ